MKTILQNLLLSLVVAAVSVTGCGRTAEQPLNGLGGKGITAAGGDAGQGGGIGAGGSGGARTGTVIPARTPAIHRASAASCVGVHSPSEPDSAYVSSGSQCTRHADCTVGQNGKCVSGIGYAANRYYCIYDTCATDANCDPGKVCYCSTSASARCLSLGNCRTDADCGGGSYSYCSPSMGPDCSGYHSIDSYRCHTPADTCIDDSDCTGGDYCSFSDYAGRWTCTAKNMSCAIG
jgi:hypothetical protein